jgi:hypothetical protein
MDQPEARSRERRKRDALERLRNDVDLWVASAGSEGDAYLIPLSFYWDGAAITIATPRKSRTARNLIRAGLCRVGLGQTRDVVMIDGTVEERPIGADPKLEDAHAEAAGFDPRTLSTEYVYLRIEPTRIQAWREENELADRDLMRSGKWLV